jgi:hypothetical protein
VVFVFSWLKIRARHRFKRSRAAVVQAYFPRSTSLAFA